MTYEKYTDDLIALTVVFATVGGQLVGIDIPTEPMMLIVGYYFGQKAAGGIILKR